MSKHCLSVSLHISRALTDTTSVMKKTLLYLFAGLAAGFLNGLFGAGGGVIAVKLLKRFGLSAKQSHATAIALMLPLCVLSAAIYYNGGLLDFVQAAGYLPAMLGGAAAGALFFKKLRTVWLRRLFGAVILFSAVRMLLR